MLPEGSRKEAERHGRLHREAPQEASDIDEDAIAITEMITQRDIRVMRLDRPLLLYDETEDRPEGNMPEVEAQIDAIEAALQQYRRNGTYWP